MFFSWYCVQKLVYYLTRVRDSKEINTVVQLFIQQNSENLVIFSLKTSRLENNNLLTVTSQGKSNI